MPNILSRKDEKQNMKSVTDLFNVGTERHAISHIYSNVA